LRGGCGWSRRERLVEAIDRSAVATWYEVPVVVHGDLYAVVPELIADVSEPYRLLS
jgi:hypothetical protein